MKSIASYVSLALTVAFLAFAALFLNTDQLEYCGQLHVTRSNDQAANAEFATPTLAPPLKVVFLRVESDHSGLQIGWIE